ncbi:MAG: trehalose-phosphatase [Gammaproteobacteria bacterium]
MPREPDSMALPAWNPRWAFFLDVDGTLVEIAAHPDLARVTPRLIELLRRLPAAVGGAMALVSGRSIASLDAMLAPLELPLAGLHGLERRDAAGRVHHAMADEERLHGAKNELWAFAENHPGLLVEDKGPAVAVHFRGAPSLETAVRDRLADVVKRLGAGWCLQRGKKVLEIKPTGRNKGTAIEEFMREAPFAGRVPVFIGDDVTDEAGFEAVNRLGGHSIGVGVDGRSHAVWHVDDVGDVLDWIASLLDARARAAAG